ncbi:MAG: flippase-like domain-containing protein [Clostridia bacterium]|nr:flippase-like domain-containing protein [Clostridia bacterium]
MKPKKHRWGLIICAVAFVLMLFYLFIGGEAQMLGEALKSFKIEYLFIIFLLMIVNWGMEAISIHWLTKQVHPAQKFRHTCTTTMIGQYYNCITPLSSGGQPMQAYYMAKFGTPPAASMSALLVRMIVYEIALMLYSAFVLVAKLGYFFEGQNTILVILALMGFGMNLIGVLFFFVVGFWKKGTVAVVHWAIGLLAKIRIIKKKDEVIAKTDKQLDGAYENMRFVMRHPSAVIGSIFLTFIQLTAFFSISYFIYLGFVQSPTADYMTVLASQSMVCMVSAMFPLPGAIGLTETSYVMYFKNIYPVDRYADISMVMWRLLTFYAAIVIGIIITVVLSRRFGKAEKTVPPPKTE